MSNLFGVATELGKKVVATVLCLFSTPDSASRLEKVGSGEQVGRRSNTLWRMSQETAVKWLAPMPGAGRDL